MTAVARLAPEIVVDGQVLDHRWLEALVELRAESGIRAVGQTVLRFADPGYTLATNSRFALGSQVEVKVVGGGAICGVVVTGVGVEQRDGLAPELVVTGHDMAHRLTGSSTVRTFLLQTAGQIISSVAGKVGLTAKVQGKDEPHDYLLQAGTDLDFIDELTTRMGWDWYVDGLTIVAGPPGERARVSRRLGADLMEFSVRASSRYPVDVLVHGWNRDEQERVESASHAVADSALVPTTALVTPYMRGRKGGSGARGKGSTTAITSSTSVTDKKEADRMAAMLRDRLASAAVTARGRGHVDPAIVPGVAVQVADAGPASGTYRVMSVTHTYRRSGFETAFEAGERRLSAIVDAGTSARSTAGMSLSGLMVGIVTNNKDEVGLGRVKVKYCAMSDIVESAWARVVTAGAGDKRGAFFLPDVNDEVLLGFEGDDPRFPVVIGGLYSKKAKPPPYADRDDAGHRRITSKSGHVIEISDGDSSQLAHIKLSLAGQQHVLRLGKDRTDLELPPNVPFRLRAGAASIDIDGRGNVAIDGVKVAINASQELTLNGLTVGVKATGQLTAEGTAVTVKGRSATSVEAQGAVLIKGAAVKIN